MNYPGRIGIALIKIAALYLMAALVVGMTMAMSHDYSLTPVHTHIGLLGWASLAITGLVYVMLPSCERSRMAGAHFWLHNAGLPIQTAGLVVMILTGSASVEPIIGLGSVMVVIGLLVFTVNVFKNARPHADVTSQVPALSAKG